MKNQSFLRRLGYAWSGIQGAWKAEKSFRAQVFIGAGALGLLVVTQPHPLWWAIFMITIGLVLAGEAFNTALERVVDRLHPDIHPVIASAKDCAAGAVLILSISSLGVLISFLIFYFFY